MNLKIKYILVKIIFEHIHIYNQLKIIKLSNIKIELRIFREFPDNDDASSLDLVFELV